MPVINNVQGYDPATGAPLTAAQVAYLNGRAARQTLGFSDPNPGVQRLRTLPKVMTSPPTLKNSPDPVSTTTLTA